MNKEQRVHTHRHTHRFFEARRCREIWVRCEDDKMLSQFKDQLQSNLALDGGNQLVYLAPTRVNLQLTEERWPDIHFAETRETLRFVD